jgi:superfamily II DNA or RNA helicase
MNDYDAWVDGKFKTATFDGIDVPESELTPSMFPHQRDLVRWALRKGRAAIFADTGLGKSLMELEWARHVAKRGRVLVLAPLAVSAQMVSEGRKFGIDCAYARDDAAQHAITVTNYEMLHAFDASVFAGVVLDESSILKAFDGRTRTLLIQSFQRTPYRLACTATPAPNDFTELGNHSEFLGVKSRPEMLAEFFVHDGGSTQDWRIKGHAVTPFWKWVASWGAIVKTPADLGHDDSAFALPPLRMHEVVVPIEHSDAWKEGFLFAPDVRTLADARATRRATLDRRVERAVELCAGDEPAIVWCELNDEGDACAAAIPGAVQVAGADTPEEKAERLVGFAEGRYRVMVSKGKIAGFGLNWQHCRRMVFVGASHSYEQTYQAIRRCWRFGQSRPVDVFVIRAETEGAVVANYRRKEADAARMAAEMTARVRDSVRAEVVGASRREWNEYEPRKSMVIPQWLREDDAA